MRAKKFVCCLRAMLLLAGVSFISCGNSSKAKADSELTTQNGEDFKSFLDKFTSSAAFQYTRIKFPLKTPITLLADDGETEKTFPFTREKWPLLDSETMKEEQTPGGVGIQVQGEWTHHFSPKWSLTANAAFATKYFPDITADVALRHYLKNDWEIGAHVGYRRVAAYTKRYEWNDEFFAGGTGDNGYLFTGWNESKTNLLTVGGELAKTIEVVRLNTKIDMHFFNSNFYYNAQIGAKYFPASDTKTNINAMASIGSAPETAVLDYALPGSFSHTNTMVGLGGQYMVSPNITIGLMGTWNTYYNQTNTVRGTSPSNQIESISTRYKNLYNIYAQVYISF
jgi:hypothetical protein